MHGDALSALADVVGRRGDTAGARALLDAALELYRAKKHQVSVERTDDLLAKLVSSV